MARTVRDARLETRTARLKLSGDERHWKAIDAGRHLGYRRGGRKASWLARYRTQEGRYRFTVLGLADDVEDADGATVLTFSQAQEKARTYFANQAGRETGQDETETPATVADVMEAYLAWFKHHRKGFTTVLSNVRTHILPALGDIKVADFSSPQKVRSITRRIKAFHQDLATAPARIRTRKGGDQKFKDAPDTPDKQRARKATANKILSTLKAALNQAYTNGDIPTDTAWRQVKPFRNVDAPKIRFLDLGEVVRLVNACDPAFRPLVQGAVLTGCRYGELARLTVSDFNARAGSLHIAESKSGKSRTVYLTDEGVGFFTAQSDGKSGDALVFPRSNGDAWKASQQARPMMDACTAANISPPISFHILRHCYGSRLAMQGVPMKVIAHQLGHADTRITEKHYAHLSGSHIAETVRGAFGVMGVTEQEPGVA